MLARPLIVIAIIALAVPFGSAATNLVVNGDFEVAGTDPTDIPGWTDDHCAEGKSNEGTLTTPALAIPDPVNTTIPGQTIGIVVPAPNCTLALDGIGANASRGLMIMGPEVRRSSHLFPVTAGASLRLQADAYELIDDTGSSANPDFDSAVALEFVNATGSSIYQLVVHCDDWKAHHQGGSQKSCTATDPESHLLGGLEASQFNHLFVPDPNSSLAKYNAPIVVPAGAVYGRILLGGSRLTMDNGPKGASLPLATNFFDNVLVSDS